VLIEQEDWFEKEICFVRRLLQPGMRAADIGANYGTCTLAMARPGCRWRPGLQAGLVLSMVVKAAPSIGLDELIADHGRVSQTCRLCKEPAAAFAGPDP
jgi:hypothetical protein